MRKVLNLVFDLIFSKIRYIKIGKNSKVPHRDIQINGTNLFVGDYVSIGHGCKFELAPNSKICVRTGTIIGPRCTFFCRTHNYDRDGLESIPFDHVNIVSDIIINEGCWLGDSVIVLPGVIIGKGAVIGAGSVISSSIPDYAVVVGNPAKIVRYRNSERFDALLAQGKFKVLVDLIEPKGKEFIFRDKSK